MGSEEGVNSPFRFMCPLRMPACQRVTQTENGLDLTIWAPPLFCTSAGRGHAVRLFYFRCSGLNDRYLSIFPGNGEFSVSSFRHYEIADSPPNSPFALCRGHTNFRSHNPMKRGNLEKSEPLSVRILQRMVVKNRPSRTGDNIYLRLIATTYIKQAHSDLTIYAR